MGSLSASLEDYLELICNSLDKNESVKAADIARTLNVSRASVSEALNKLAEKQLITYEGHKTISITPLGLKKANEVILKHNTLTSFFENILGLDKSISEETACRVEHVISDDVLEKIDSFQKYCNKNKKFIDEFKDLH